MTSLPSFRGRDAAIFVLAIVGLLPLLLPDYLVFQATMFLIYAVALLGLNILVGYNGQISLGHGAFFALGAYSAAIALEHLGLPYWITPFVAAGFCFIVGFILGFPALRLGGIYLALATFALALAAPQLLKHKALAAWTGGVQGVVILKPDAPIQSLLGFAVNADRWLYLFSLAITVLLFWTAANILTGRTGRALLAIRDHPTAAAAMGVNISLVKSTTFGISAAYAGVAGSLFALAVGFVAPDSFPGFLSITLLVGIVVGGLSTLSGPLLGALFVLLVPNLAEQVSKSAPAAIYGLLLIGLMALMPGGIVGSCAAAWRRLRGRHENLVRPTNKLPTSSISQQTPQA